MLGPVRAARLTTFAAVVAAYAAQLNVTVSQNGTARLAPMTGFGNEFVFQSNADANLNANLAAAGSRMCRYPGGTPADYWLWDLGWVNVTSDHSGSAGLPFRPTTPIELRAFLDNSGQSTCVMVVNQLQKDLEYEVAGLLAHARAGTPVTHIELGNEMYDATRPDVLAAYPEPRDYAEKMAVWTAGIKAAFPHAKVALDGLANTWDARTEAWNGQVLQNPVSARADAATVHLYPGLPSPPLTPAAFPPLLALVFATVDGYRSYIAASVPQRMEVWVTEWGTWGNENITGTWLQALWHGALLTLLPTIPPVSVVLPYCASCHDPNMPSFVSQWLQYGPIAPVNATDALWARTPSGHAYALLFSGVTSASEDVAALAFSPNPQLDPSVADSRQLVGLLGLRGGAACSAGIINLGATEVTLSVGGLQLEGCSVGVHETDSSKGASASFDSYWADIADLVRQNISVPELQHASGAVDSSVGIVTLPGYSMTIVTG